MGQLPRGVRQALDIAKREPAYRYVQAERARQGARQQVSRAFKQVDFLLAPTLPVLPPRKSDETVETAKGSIPVLQAHISYTCLFDQTGHPAVSLPIHRNDQGLGASVQIVAPLDEDKAAVDLAVALEEARGPLQG
ncbi:amidase family protein [Fodinicurvata halophila]|uniref:amidase family protein n=1 Tax=Fodinicurvata halophila TaxID=1419723 RepID=UPI0036331762